MTVPAYKIAMAKLLKVYHKKFDAFGKKRKGKKRAKR